MYKSEMLARVIFMSNDLTNEDLNMIIKMTKPVVTITYVLFGRIKKIVTVDYIEDTKYVEYLWRW